MRKIIEKGKSMNNQDFRDIILKQRKGKSPINWTGSVLDYLSIVKEHPEVAQFAPGRIYNMIMKRGTTELPHSYKIQGYEDLVKYNFFDGKIFGTLEPIHDLMRFLKAASHKTETGKRVLLMVGPVSSGKSTIAALIKKGLELDETPAYCIEGCPLHEEPLHLIPPADRDFWGESLGVKIDGEVCPVCQHMIDTKYTDENGHVRWEDVPVEQFTFSEQRRSGIGTFQPSDPKSQDITELIGRINMTKAARWGDTDPRAYEFNGELEVANRGVVEYIEILKADVKFHYVLLTATQEQRIKAPGFPQIYIDTLILSHTNQTEFDNFKSDKKNEALHDRMYPVVVPWNLKVDDEIKIYEKMIAESDFKNFHIAPFALRAAAQFAVLSRLKKSSKVSNLVEKMKLYNGEVSKEFKKTDIDVKALREEGRRLGEGMTGISPRFIIDALDVGLGSKTDKKCINPIDVIRCLRNKFAHQMSMDEDEVKTFMNLLIGDKDSITTEFKEWAKKEINMAFLHAYDEQANELFNRYMVNVKAYCKNEKIMDSITGEYSSPDEKLMRSIEEKIGVPENSKKEFRNQIFVYKADVQERGKVFSYMDYDPLRDAIQKKLMGDLRNVVSLSLADPTKTDAKSKRSRNKALKRLIERGHCEHCANVLLKVVGEILRRE